MCPCMTVRTVDDRVLSHPLITCLGIPALSHNTSDNGQFLKVHLKQGYVTFFAGIFFPSVLVNFMKFLCFFLCFLFSLMSLS